MSRELAIEDLGGLWRRSLMAWPDGRRDTTSWVNWLQGPSFYVDLRQPLGRPDFREVTSLDGLTRAQIEWLAGQEGFAGELTWLDGTFEWHREVDFQVKAADPDRGRLRREGDIMVEEGMSEEGEEGLGGRYVEHWHREAAGPAPACALRFEDRPNGCRGFIVRRGDVFMYARGRSTAVCPALHFHEHVANAPSLAAAQDLIDCEISQGAVTAAAWIIRRSTLPFKEGRRLDPRFVEGRTAGLAITDLSRDGRSIERQVEITDVQGKLRNLCRESGAASEAMAGEVS
jgi:hypothetical protein